MTNKMQITLAQDYKMSRRNFLALTSGGALTLAKPSALLGADSPAIRRFTLTAAESRAQLVADSPNATRVWAYNHSTPGPEIRVRQGDRVRIEATNRLDAETTVHWHGLRVPNAMDGVPHLTQAPIAVGGQFRYEFDVPDAGTYWYHPHLRSHEQLARGLYGAFIVEERHPVVVDRDITWILDDWRLDGDAQIEADFDNRHDASHGGRMGNTLAVNGKAPEALQVRRGERIRLRLINAANARIFRLRFDGHQPRIIAFDGQPVAPHPADNSTIELGPAMRADLVLDMTGDPGQRHPVLDSSFGYESPFLDIAYEDTVLREALLESPIALEPNALAEPDWSDIRHHKILFSDVTNDDRLISDSGLSVLQMIEAGRIWAVNGRVGEGMHPAPFLTLESGRSYHFDIHNDTAWPHPIHFHGHAFRVVSRDGEKTRHNAWRDTVLLAPYERVGIAFVADNPGDWLFHCHTQEHHATGMVGVIRVLQA